MLSLRRLSFHSMSQVKTLHLFIIWSLYLFSWIFKKFGLFKRYNYLRVHTQKQGDKRKQTNSAETFQHSVLYLTLTVLNKLVHCRRWLVFLQFVYILLQNWQGYDSCHSLDTELNLSGQIILNSYWSSGYNLQLNQWFNQFFHSRYDHKRPSTYWFGLNWYRGVHLHMD